jgi:hypothetical protein
MEDKKQLHNETKILLNKIIVNEIKILNEEYIKLLEKHEIKNNILNALKLEKYKSYNGRYDQNEKYSYVNFYFTDEDEKNTLKIRCKENLQDSWFQYYKEVFINGEKMYYWSSDNAYNCGYYSSVYQKYNIPENIVNDIVRVIYDKWNELDNEFIDLVNLKICHNFNP